MAHGEERQTRIALLILAAVLAIALAVLEVLADQGEAEAFMSEAGEIATTGSDAAVWVAPIRRLDDALASHNASEANRAWQQAHLAALGSRRWEGMVEVGDAARRLGLSTGTERVQDPRARQAYLVAFYRARTGRSLQGLLRVADAFGSLGDMEVVKQCLQQARGLLAQRPDDASRVWLEALEQKLAERSFASGPLRIEPF